MGAKAYIFAFAVLAATGCSGGLKRFAPPGIVKYEELEKGQPPNPEIVARIKAHKEETDGGFPNLSEQPTALPEGIAKPERDAMTAALVAERDALNAAVAEDRAIAVSEREEAITDERDTLNDAVQLDDASARRERGLPPKPADVDED